MELEAFELVILRRPARPTEYDDETADRIQREHLAFHTELRERGVVVTNGPVRDQPDDAVRGLTFYRTGSLERTREFAAQDPAVRAGRLEVEVMTWWCPAGTMVRPGRAFTVPDR